MLKDELYTELKVVIAVYIPDEYKDVEITEKTHFLKDLNINSAHLVDIILDVEDKFDIEISDKDAEQMLTVEAAMTIIQEKTNK